MSAASSAARRSASRPTTTRPARAALRSAFPCLVLDAAPAAGNGGGRPAIRFRDGDGREPAEARFATLEIDGTVPPDRARELDERIWAHMEHHRHLRPDEIGAYLDGTTARHSDPLALTQLIVAYQIVQAGIARGTRLAAQPGRRARLLPPRPPPG